MGDHGRLEEKRDDLSDFQKIICAIVGGEPGVFVFTDPVRAFRRLAQSMRSERHRGGCLMDNRKPLPITEAERNESKRFQNSQTGLVDDRVASGMLGVAPGTMRKWRVIGSGPKYVKFRGAVRYDTNDIRDFIVTHKVGSTSEIRED
jgi:hypothetical protein